MADPFILVVEHADGDMGMWHFATPQELQAAKAFVKEHPEHYSVVLATTGLNGERPVSLDAFIFAMSPDDDE